ncbi:tetratricopeptide repeat protein [Spirulina sp. CS-785/01]|uniref:tetratricopeptide repeat protein n=1 Tax=Spirulina sp. CS-785/01 TaxID=3021716 RepID=UPI00232D87FE|nr:tetratricopeptide repeat protein [Spirulina sp. CS-785/01]MDB9312718.1 tetratricopeptide repeat protein [Spirulina sp. CS-785/01]
MKTTRPRNRWLYVVLILVILIFVGVSLLPALESALQANQSASSSASPVQSPTPSQQEELAMQARGYQMVLEREPDNTTALEGLIEVRLQQGRLEDALAPLERLAKTNPQQPDYWILLAQARRHLGNDEGAFQAYEQALQNNPGYIKALQGMVALQLEKDRPERAIGLLETTLQTAAQANTAQPGSIDVASVQMLLGRVYEHEERYTEAITVYDKIIDNDPQDFRPVWAKAEILKERENYEEAKSLYNRALAIAPAKYKDQIKRMAEAIPDS